MTGKLDKKTALLIFAGGCIISAIPLFILYYISGSVPAVILTTIIFLYAIYIGFKYAECAIESALLVGLTLPFVVLLNIIISVLIDPTSHNLWPFEIVYSAMISFTSAFVGVFIGRWVSVRRRKVKNVAD